LWRWSIPSDSGGTGGASSGSGGWRPQDGPLVPLFASLRTPQARTTDDTYPARDRGKCPDFSRYKDRRQAANQVRPDFSLQPLR
jgi:hypothetical protein